MYQSWIFDGRQLFAVQYWLIDQNEVENCYRSIPVICICIDEHKISLSNANWNCGQIDNKYSKTHQQLIIHIPFTNSAHLYCTYYPFPKKTIKMIYTQINWWVSKYESKWNSINSMVEQPQVKWTKLHWWTVKNRQNHCYHQIILLPLS